MKPLMFLLAMLLLMPAVSAEVQMKDENGKYRYHDPAVRQRVFRDFECLENSWGACQSGKAIESFG